MNFCLSASLSDSISLAHWSFNMSCSLSFFCCSIFVPCFLVSYYHVKILSVSWTFLCLVLASVRSLWTFLSWSSIQSLAYTYSSRIPCSSLAFFVHKLLFSLNLSSSNHESGFFFSKIISFHFEFSFESVCYLLLSFLLSLFFHTIKFISHFSSYLFRRFKITHELQLELLIFSGKKGC